MSNQAFRLECESQAGGMGLVVEGAGVVSQAAQKRTAAAKRGDLGEKLELEVNTEAF